VVFVVDTDGGAVSVETIVVLVEVVSMLLLAVGDVVVVVNELVEVDGSEISMLLVVDEVTVEVLDGMVLDRIVLVPE
jgi:hypothetical protein